MSRILKLLLLVPVWAVSVWGSLQIHTLDLQLGHSICGPWGCGPPVEALLGYHAFWLAMLAPVVIGAGFFFSPAISKRIGWAVLVMGLLVTLSVAGRDTYSLWASSGSAKYLIQKFFFAIATKIDIPMTQILIAGSALVWFGRRSSALEISEKPQVAASESLTMNVV